MWVGLRSSSRRALPQQTHKTKQTNKDQLKTSRACATKTKNKQEPETSLNSFMLQPTGSAADQYIREEKRSFELWAKPIEITSIFSLSFNTAAENFLQKGFLTIWLASVYMNLLRNYGRITKPQSRNWSVTTHPKN